MHAYARHARVGAARTAAGTWANARTGGLAAEVAGGRSPWGFLFVARATARHRVAEGRKLTPPAFSCFGSVQWRIQEKYLGGAEYLSTLD